jgi:hypothetical protein
MMGMLKALKGGTSFKPLPVFGGASRFVSRINTSLSIPFMFGNAPKDFFTGMFNLSSTPLKGKQWQVIKEMPGAYKELIDHVFRGKESDMLKEMGEHGGKVGWKDNIRQAADISDMLKEMEKAASGKDKLKYFKMFMHGIENANEVVEQSLRHAAYKTARKQGLSADEAARIASGLTVDFTKHGAIGPLANSLWAFTNANLMGNARLFDTLKNTKEGKAMAIGLVGMGLTLGLLNAANKDEDGVPFIDKVPWWIQSKNAIITDSKGNQASLPLPYGLNIFSVLGGEIARAMSDPKKYNEAESVGRVMATLGDAFNPIGSGPLEQQITPTLLKPAVQIATDKNWYGAPLSPKQSPYAKVKRPDAYNAYGNENQTYVATTQWLNDHTGGNKAKPGKIDVSPSTIRVLMDFALGSAGKFFTRSQRVYENAKKTGKIDVNEVPVVNRFLRTKSKYADQTLFYDNIKKVAELENQLKAYADDPEKLEEIKADSDNEHLLSLIPKAKDAERQLRYLRKKEREAKKNKASNKYLAKIREQMAEIYMAFNKLTNLGEGDIPQFKPARTRKSGKSRRHFGPTFPSADNFLKVKFAQ